MNPWPHRQFAHKADRQTGRAGLSLLLPGVQLVVFSSIDGRQSLVNALFAKMWMVSSTSMFVKSAVTS